MMQGDLPPSSSKHGVRFLAAAWATSRPVKVLPVKMILSNRVLVTALATSTCPKTHWNASLSSQRLKKKDIFLLEYGDYSLGFTTAALPAAMTDIRGAKIVK